MPFHQLFKDYIKTNALFLPGERILLAVSGGKDSVLMAQLFKLSGFQFSIAHCNFNLRAAESQRDEAFVKLLAAELDVPFHVAHFDTKTYAAEQQLSTQMAARALRYQWFEEVRERENYDYIALAHHQTDNVETILLNLVRGTGISGLHGILPKRDRIIRPLLCFSREDIDQFIAESGFDYVIDSSNETTTYTRNNIRLNVLPHLREVNPNLEETFSRNISLFAQTEEVLQQVVAAHRKAITREKKGIVYFALDAVAQLNPQKLLLFELLRPFHFTYPVAEEIAHSLKKQSGTSFYSTTHRATIDRDDLIITSLEQGAPRHCFWHKNDLTLVIGQQKIALSYEVSTKIGSDSNKAYIDADQLIFPLVVRFRQEGDKFMPLGMKNHKKLSDFLIGIKIPLPQKDQIPILVNGNGEIIWVVGLRQDNRYKVNTGTKKVAIFEVLNP
ncbi:MAG: tRNA lysidine(34) synthetase TilS [Pedobacter sp.]|nr:tRNA lysidine(34) synthetase TilS [Pedobacter sp.]MDQ8053573.1 tRNA lysidine(34) synthetase TilS [Pedobacter sp.]